MTPEEEQELSEHINGIAKILYKQARPEQIKTLAQIEATVREQTLQYITPQLGFFLSNKLRELQQDEPES